MSGKLLIFDSHPVQYKAPVYQQLDAARSVLALLHAAQAR